jgi:hypothetical protein
MRTWYHAAAYLPYRHVCQRGWRATVGLQVVCKKLRSGLE